MSTLLHPFQSPVEHIELPGRFTNPFHYEPHPLCVLAAAEVQAYLATRCDWADELRQGKMFGVLVVRTADGGLPGYLAAFSGLLAGKSVHPFFVPPVYDLQRPGGFFKPEEEIISALNGTVNTLRPVTEAAVFPFRSRSGNSFTAVMPKIFTCHLLSLSPRRGYFLSIKAFLLYAIIINHYPAFVKQNHSRSSS